MTDRERFEAWYASDAYPMTRPIGWHTNGFRLNHGEYWVGEVQEEWLTWQAATAAAEADVEEAKARRDHTRQWYGTRFETLWHWAHKRLPEDLRNEYFNIVANDTPTSQDPPTYAQQLNMAIHRAKRAEADKWEAVRRCAQVCEKAEIQTVAAKGRETAARIKVAIKVEFPEAFK